MWTKESTRTALAGALWMTAMGSLGASPSLAESGKSSAPVAASPAVSIPTAVAPDVQIVVSPDPNGHWVVAAVYPNKTDRKKAEARAKEMLTLGAWKGSGLRFENKALDRVEEAKDLAPLPVMSSVSVTTPGNIVNYADGTISLEPFIRAYRDLNRMNILFLVPGTFQYRGPKSYRDGDIDMTYAPGGSAFTYAIQIKNHSLQALRLPRVEPAVAGVAPAANAPKSGASSAGKMAGVVGIALAAAGLAFFGVQRWNTR